MRGDICRYSVGEPMNANVSSVFLAPRVQSNGGA